ELALDVDLARAAEEAREARPVHPRRDHLSGERDALHEVDERARRRRVVLERLHQEPVEGDALVELPRVHDTSSDREVIPCRWTRSPPGPCSWGPWASASPWWACS